jgi:hypothetical protein
MFLPLDVELDERGIFGTKGGDASFGLCYVYVVN